MICPYKLIQQAVNANIFIYMNILKGTENYRK